MTRFSTFNINSIRARIPVLERFLLQQKPDILLLQEIKAMNEQFPYHDIEAMGYHAIIVGQKSYNGVAILYRQEHMKHIKHISSTLNITDDDQARFCHITYHDMHIINIYAPNGNPAFDDGKPSAKLLYKIEWLRQLRHYITPIMQQEQPLIIAGDYNICPYDHDCFDANHMQHDALLHPEIRDIFFSMQYLGLYDAMASMYPDDVIYSYWDYVKGRFAKNEGLRIDHMLVSPHIMDNISNIFVDTEPRTWDKPSDHTPVILDLHRPAS